MSFRVSVQRWRTCQKDNNLSNTPLISPCWWSSYTDSTPKSKPCGRLPGVYLMIVNLTAQYQHTLHSVVCWGKKKYVGVLDAMWQTKQQKTAMAHHLANSAPSPTNKMMMMAAVAS